MKGELICRSWRTRELRRDHLIPLVDEGLGNSAYLADLGGGRALAVDASRDLRALRQAAARRGLRVAFAADTHLHADFLSGAVQLAADEGATVLAAAAGHRAFPHTALADGDEVDLGGLTLRALATPGHTDEHLSYLLLDGNRELGVFTGGSLIVGSAARTDLLGADRAEELARAQYRSLRRLADAARRDRGVADARGRVVLLGPARRRPGHHHRRGEGGQPAAGRTGRGRLRPPRCWPAWAPTPPTSPGSPRSTATAPRWSPAAPGLAPLTPAAVRSLIDRGGWVVDVRPVADFAAGHIPGAVSIPLRDQFATWLGWLVPDGVPLGFVLAPARTRPRSPGRPSRSAMRTWPASWTAAWPPGRRTAGRPSAPGWSPPAAWTAARCWMSGRTPSTPPGTSPVRSMSSSATCRPGSQAAPAGAVVMCGHGERAMTAASLLQRAGHRGLAVLAGGAGDWAAATGQPLQEGP